MTKSASPTDVSEFTVDQSLSLTHKIVEFLNWAALHRPHQILAYNLIWKAVTGEKRMHDLASKEADFVRSATSRARKILLQKYQRGMHSEKGLGIRATVDDADMVKTDLAVKGRRVQAAVGAFTASANVVNLKNIPNTPEMQRYMTFAKAAKRIAVTFQTPDFIKALTPGTPNEDP